MHSVNSVEFCKRAQSSSFRRPLFSKTFWVQRTDREWWQVTSQGKPLSRALLPTLIRPGRGGQIKSFGSELKLKISESASKLIHADSDGQNVCFFCILKIGELGRLLQNWTKNKDDSETIRELTRFSWLKPWMRSRWLKKSFREGLCRYCVKLFVVFFTKIVSGEPATTHTVFFEKPSLYPVHLSKQLLRIIEFQIVKGVLGQAHSFFN